MGDQHDSDREAAARIRAFPVVPKLEQAPFPHDRKVGFAGHYVEGEFCVQGPAEFEAMNVTYKADAWYLRSDPRPNRKPKIEVAGLLESNVAFSAGLSRVLAGMAEAERFTDVRRMTLSAGKAGMQELADRSGYWAAYMALHPDSEGTLSMHFGQWPVDRKERKLIGRSATGKRGRKGLRNLGDAFMSVLRHHEAIELPTDLVWRPLKNLKERDPDDWAVGSAMDRVLREELSKLPDGANLLQQADEYQKEAARDWLARYEAGAAGLAKLKTERDAALKAAERRRKASERLARMKDNKLESTRNTTDAERERLSTLVNDLLKSVKKTDDEVFPVLDLLKPGKDETMEDAARRVVQESVDARNEAKEAKEEVVRLETEIGLFRQLFRLVEKLLVLLNVPQIAEKLGREVKDILREIRALVADSSAPKHEHSQPDADQNRPKQS